MSISALDFTVIFGGDAFFLARAHSSSAAVPFPLVSGLFSHESREACVGRLPP